MHARQYIDIEDTYYPAIRRALDNTQVRLDDDQLEIYMSELFPGTSAEDVENFMRSLQRFGRQVAPVAQRALPGIIQGAAQGGMVAGPWGALAGAVGGGAASLLSGGGRSAARPQTQPQTRPQPQNQQRPATQPASPVQMSGPAQGAMPAIQQLLALLSRPETMQALSALLMSSAGRSNVSVGNQSAPAAAFANAIAELAAEVADTAFTGHAETISDYLMDSTGAPRCDVVNPSERARLLVEDLNQLAAQEYIEDEYYDDFEDEDEDEDELDDAAEIDAEYIDEQALDDYEDALYGRSN